MVGKDCLENSFLIVKCEILGQKHFGTAHSLGHRERTVFVLFYCCERQHHNHQVKMERMLTTLMGLPFRSTLLVRRLWVALGNEVKGPWPLGQLGPQPEDGQSQEAHATIRCLSDSQGFRHFSASVCLFCRTQCRGLPCSRVEGIAFSGTPPPQTSFAPPPVC